MAMFWVKVAEVAERVVAVHLRLQHHVEALADVPPATDEVAVPEEGHLLLERAHLRDHVVDPERARGRRTGPSRCWCLRLWKYAGNAGEPLRAMLMTFSTAAEYDERSSVLSSASRLGRTTNSVRRNRWARSSSDTATRVLLHIGQLMMVDQLIELSPAAQPILSQALVMKL